MRAAPSRLAAPCLLLLAVTGALAQSSIDFFASGGGISSALPCAPVPWTYTGADGVTRTITEACADLTDPPPLTSAEFDSTDPANTDTSKWCPTVQEYSSATGSSWGFCVSIRLGDQDGRPTASPVALNESPVPTAAPGDFGSASPTTSPSDAPVAPSVTAETPVPTATPGISGSNGTEATETPTAGTEGNSTTSAAPTASPSANATAAPTASPVENAPSIAPVGNTPSVSPVGGGNATTEAPSVGNATETPAPSGGGIGGTPTPSPNASPVANSTEAPTTATVNETAAPTGQGNATTSEAPTPAGNETGTETPTPFVNDTSSEAPTASPISGNGTSAAPTTLGGESNVTNATVAPTGIALPPTAGPTAQPTFADTHPTGEARVAEFGDGQGITGNLRVTVIPMKIAVVEGTLEGLPPNCVQCFIGIHEGFSCNDETGFDSPGELVSGIFSGTIMNMTAPPEVSMELAPITSDSSGRAEVNVNLVTDVSVLGRTILVYVPGPTQAPTTSPTSVPTGSPISNSSTTETPTASTGGVNATVTPTISGESNVTAAPTESNGNPSMTPTPTTSGGTTNETQSPTVSEGNVTVPTSSPVGGGGTSTAAPTSSGPELSFFATDGWMEEDTPCADAPWTFVDMDESEKTVNSSCVPFTVLEPYMGGGQQPKLPTNEDADETMWCPTVARYDKDPSPPDVSDRKLWGYCLPVTGETGSRRVLQEANETVTPGACGKIIPLTGEDGVPVKFAEILPRGYPFSNPSLSLNLEDGHVTYIPRVEVTWDVEDVLGGSEGGGEGGGEAGNTTVPTNKTDETNSTTIEEETNSTVTGNETEVQPNMTIPSNETVPGRNDTDVDPGTGGGGIGVSNETVPGNDTIPVNQTVPGGSGGGNNDTDSTNRTAPGGGSLPPSNDTNVGNESIADRLLQTSAFNLVFFDGSCSNRTEVESISIPVDSAKGRIDDETILSQLDSFSGGSLLVESVSNASNFVCDALREDAVPRGTLVAYEVFFGTVITLIGSGFQPGKIAIDAPCEDGIPLNVTESGTVEMTFRLERQLVGEPKVCITTENEVTIAEGRLNSESVEPGPTVSPSLAPIAFSPTPPTMPTTPSPTGVNETSAPQTFSPTASPINGTGTLPKSGEGGGDLALPLGLAFGLGIPILLIAGLLIKRRSKRSGGGSTNGGSPQYSSTPSGTAGTERKQGSFKRFFGGSNLSTQNKQ